MACCAIAPGCGNPACDLCTRVALLPQPTFHSDQQKRDRAELKDSAPVPDLSGPRAAATALAFRKRKREGAVRQQR